MNDGLENLERRVATLIEHHRKSRQQIQQLEKQVKEHARENQRLGREHEQMRQRIGELENELASRGSREDVVKNRLQQILGQIDLLEAEITQIEAGGDVPGQAN